jgi:hypothetical protein
VDKLKLIRAEGQVLPSRANLNINPARLIGNIVELGSGALPGLDSGGIEFVCDQLDAVFLLEVSYGADMVNVSMGNDYRLKLLRVKAERVDIINEALGTPSRT